jgi:cytosine deaminase
LSVTGDLRGLRCAQLLTWQTQDFVVFRARCFSELLSRPQADRAVVRGGAQVAATVPDYSELDDLVTVPQAAAPAERG